MAQIRIWNQVCLGIGSVCPKTKLYNHVEPLLGAHRGLLAKDRHYTNYRPVRPRQVVSEIAYN